MDHQNHEHQNHQGGMSTTPSMPSSSHHEHHNMKMDHSAHSADQTQTMDHSKMNHEQHVGGSAEQSMDHSSHGMAMWFHGGYASEVVLFSWWKINSIGGLIGSCIAIFIVGVLYEGLKVFRDYLQKRACYCPADKQGVPLIEREEEEGEVETLNGILSPSSAGGQCQGQNNNHNSSPLTKNPSQNGATRVRRPTFKLAPPTHWLHLLQTGLHLLQVLVSYLLMLIFMTYNVWLCAAVALGAAVGYFIFGGRKMSNDPNCATNIAALAEHSFTVCSTKSRLPWSEASSWYRYRLPTNNRNDPAVYLLWLTMESCGIYLWVGWKTMKF